MASGMWGVKEMVETLKRIGAAWRVDPVTALDTEADAIVVVMKDRCPVATGNLRDAIHHEPAERLDAGRLNVIFAIGAQAPYGLFVHEDPDAKHATGEWKFMENPLKEMGPDVMAKIGEQVQFAAYQKYVVPPAKPASVAAAA